MVRLGREDGEEETTNICGFGTNTIIGIALSTVVVFLASVFLLSSGTEPNPTPPEGQDCFNLPSDHLSPAAQEALAAVYLTLDILDQLDRGCEFVCDRAPEEYITGSNGELYDCEVLCNECPGVDETVFVSYLFMQTGEEEDAREFVNNEAVDKLASCMGDKINEYLQKVAQEIVDGKPVGDALAELQRDFENLQMCMAFASQFIAFEDAVSLVGTVDEVANVVDAVADINDNVQ